MGIFSRFTGKRDVHGNDSQGESRSPETGLSEEQLDELRVTAREWIHPGFRDKVDLPTELVDFHDGFDAEQDALLRAATEIVDEEWATRVDEQRTWSGDTGHAKVSRAFDALAGQGIVARMNFACCQNCGTTEIDDERTPIRARGKGYAFREWGYVFFHQQDTERLAESPATLYLSYSVFAPAPGIDEELVARLRAGDDGARKEALKRSEVIVGTTAVEALRAEGLDVVWDGSTASRIQVTIPDWRKPLPQD